MAVAVKEKGLCLGKTSVGTANLGLAVLEGRGTAELFLELAFRVALRFYSQCV